MILIKKTLTRTHLILTILTLDFDHKFSCAAICSTSLGGRYVMVEYQLVIHHSIRGGLVQESADNGPPEPE